MTVEVERKFICDPDIQKKMYDIGAVCIGQHRFEDKYFDSPDLSLTLRDFWLRCREGCWELKCSTVKRVPEGDGTNQAEALCTRYREITSLPQIQAEVREVMKESVEGKRGNLSDSLHGEHMDNVGGSEDTENSSSDEDCWLKELNLVCFAQFTTERSSFLLDGEGGVRVDLDQADFGYCVGEIEVLVPDGDVQSALQRIEKTAKKLGLCCEQRVQGKMDVYLQRYCPDHYAKLLNVHIL